MIHAIINNHEIEVPRGTTILEAALEVNVEIPTLCKHPDVQATAACGICVVKETNYNKMLRACCTELEEGMNIITHSSEIVKVRKNVLELILSAHPNDCLRCGRNGNCELQRLVASFGIREIRFDQVVEAEGRDRSTGAIVLDPWKCIKCGRCLEVCQNMQDVWALTFLERGIHTRMAPAGDINLSQSPCVRCGQCSAHCPTGAIFEMDETRSVYELLKQDDVHCVAQIAPAVRVAIGEAFGLQPGTNLTKQLYATLRRLGFDAVFDTSFGADVTVMEEAAEFVERFTNKKEELPLITTCCPSWVDFMEKRYPEMLNHFSSCKSPMEITGVLSKTYYAQKKNIDPSKIQMVAIMPCTSKKHEIIRSKEMYASGYKDVDVSITTRELARMIKQAGINFLDMPSEKPDNILAKYTGAGVIFGTTGGVMEAALRTAYYFITGEDLNFMEFTALRGLEGVKEAQVRIKDKVIKVAIAHGLGNVKKVIDRVLEAKRKGTELPYHFIEVMACPGGCVGGGGQPYGLTDEIRKKRTAALYQDDEAHKRLRCSYYNPYIERLYNELLEKPLSATAHKLLHTTYHQRAEYKK